MSRIAPLPPQFQSQAPFAKEYQLALVSGKFLIKIFLYFFLSSS